MSQSQNRRLRKALQRQTSRDRDRQKRITAQSEDGRGQLGILNVGAGDTKLTFDPAKPAERERAAKVVTDMLRRGYAILVQVGRDEKGPLYRRAEGFDPETCEYIIVGAPDDETVPAETAPAETAPATAAGIDPKRTRRKTTRVPAESTHAVSVARSAGG